MSVEPRRETDLFCAQSPRDRRTSGLGPARSCSAARLCATRGAKPGSASLARIPRRLCGRRRRAAAAGGTPPTAAPLPDSPIPNRPSPRPPRRAPITASRAPSRQRRNPTGKRSRTRCPTSSPIRPPPRRGAGRRSACGPKRWTLPCWRRRRPPPCPRRSRRSPSRKSIPTPSRRSASTPARCAPTPMKRRISAIIPIPTRRAGARRNLRGSSLPARGSRPRRRIQLVEPQFRRRHAAGL